MSLEVVFAPKATETLLSITSFVENRWGRKMADGLIEKTYKTISLISEQPFMFKASLIHKNIRHGLINRHLSFLYEVHPTYIAILYFWDNRQDPLFE